MASQWTPNNKEILSIMINGAAAELLRAVLSSEGIEHTGICGVGGDHPPFPACVAQTWAIAIRNAIEYLENVATFLEKCDGFEQT